MNGGDMVGFVFEQSNMGFDDFYETKHRGQCCDNQISMDKIDVFQEIFHV